MTDNVNQRLLEAATRGDLEALKAALAAGADIESKDEAEMTPLTLAVRDGHVALMLHLLEHGALVTNDTLLVAGMSAASNTNILKYLQLAQIKQVKPKVSRHSPADAALLQAAHRGDAHAIRAALANGASPAASDDQDTAALRWAVRNGNADAVKALLAGGADINQRSFTGWSALIEAVIESHESLVQLLIERGADVNAQTFTAASVLYFARDIVPFARDREAAGRIIQMLEARGADYSEPETDDD